MPRFEGDAAMATLATVLAVAAPHALQRTAVRLVQATRPTMRENLVQMKIRFGMITPQRDLWDELVYRKAAVSMFAKAYGVEQGEKDYPT
jgi:hypothetical protein